MEPVSGILLVPVVQKVVVQERTAKESADIYGQMELVGQKEAEAGHLDTVGEHRGGAVLGGGSSLSQTAVFLQVGDEGAEKEPLLRGERAVIHRKVSILRGLRNVILQKYRAL